MKNVHFNVVLGSSSLSRRKILEEMGYKFTVVTADIDEKSIRREKPEDLVLALAKAKADAIIEKLRGNVDQHRETILVAADTKEAVLSRTTEDACVTNIIQPTLLITCDQVVVYKDAVREKPSHKDEARQFIRDYSGSQVATIGSVLVSNLRNGAQKSGWERAEIGFHEIPNDIIEEMIEEKRVLEVAGGLIIEHPLMLPFIKNLVGTTDSVMGLPKRLTEELMQEVM